MGGYLEVWCVKRSIVSIQLVAGTATASNWRGMLELHTLFYWMSVNASSIAPPYATPGEVRFLSRITFVGQPVYICDSHSMIWVGLGCEAMLLYQEDQEGTM